MIETRRLKNVVVFIQTTFILHCGKELLTDLYKRFLKFKENVPKYGRTTNNSYLGAFGTICVGTYNFSKKLLIH